MTQRSSLENVHACVLTWDFLSVQRHPFRKPLALRVDLSSRGSAPPLPPLEKGRGDPVGPVGRKFSPLAPPPGVALSPTSSEQSHCRGRGRGRMDRSPTSSWLELTSVSGG